MPPVYPLASVADLRKEEEEAKKRGLALAIEAHAQAAEATRHAADAASAHRSETEAVRRDEAAREGHSVSSALLAQAWLARRKTEHAALVGKIDACRQKEATLLRAIDDARAALAQARAEVEALQKHRKKWDAENALVQERRDEAEQEDRRR